MNIIDSPSQTGLNKKEVPSPITGSAEVGASGGRSTFPSFSQLLRQANGRMAEKLPGSVWGGEG